MYHGLEHATWLQFIKLKGGHLKAITFLVTLSSLIANHSLLFTDN